MSKRTMRKFDEICLTTDDIRALRGAADGSGARGTRNRWCWISGWHGWRDVTAREANPVAYCFRKIREWMQAACTEGKKDIGNNVLSRILHEGRDSFRCGGDWLSAENFRGKSREVMGLTGRFESFTRVRRGISSRHGATKGSAALRVRPGVRSPEWAAELGVIRR